MFHAQGGGRPNIVWIGVAISLFLSISTVPLACADNSPTFTGGKVTPENDTWGSTFIFYVVYTDPGNLMPAEGYPRVYISGEANERTMVENDPTDDDVTGGKLYRYEWTPAKENIDNHSFYFYVKNSRDESARNPIDGMYSGPGVTKKPTTIDNFKVDIRDPNPGQMVTFSGYLKCDNIGVSGKIEIIALFEKDNLVIGSGNADEDGYFSISIEAPDSGSFGYRAKFDGDDHYEDSRSNMECLITFDAFTIATIYGVLSAILILMLMFLLSRGISRAQYLKPVLIGLLAAMVFIFLFPMIGIITGFLGLVLPGTVAGYLYARNVSGWIRHLRAGGLVALFLVLFLCLENAYSIKEVAASYVSRIFGHSIGNGELLKLLVFDTLFFALFFTVFTGVGAIFGGLLRKLLKPAEQKPVTVAGPATTAASG